MRSYCQAEGEKGKKKYFELQHIGLPPHQKTSLKGKATLPKTKELAARGGMEKKKKSLLLQLAHNNMTNTIVQTNSAAQFGPQSFTFKPDSAKPVHSQNAMFSRSALFCHKEWRACGENSSANTLCRLNCTTSMGNLALHCQPVWRAEA